MILYHILVNAVQHVEMLHDTSTGNPGPSDSDATCSRQVVQRPVMLGLRSGVDLDQ